MLPGLHALTPTTGLTLKVTYRGRVGIEPTRGSSYLPHNGFEDRAPHQQCSIPVLVFNHKAPV